MGSPSIVRTAGILAELDRDLEPSHAGGHHRTAHPADDRGNRKNADRGWTSSLGPRHLAGAHLCTALVRKAGNDPCVWRTCRRSDAYPRRRGFQTHAFAPSHAPQCGIDWSAGRRYRDPRISYRDYERTTFWPLFQWG